MILNTLKDRSRLPSRVVILDVFRSSNTIIQLLQQGAADVIAVEDEAEARAYRARGYRAYGERGGRRLAGFDGDNSPTGVEPAVRGESVVLTTSGGTRCINACPPHSELFIGSFANAAALLRHLHQSGTGAVGFWAVGVAGTRDADEDLLCARYLEAGYAGHPADFDAVHEQLLGCPGAARLRELDQHDDLDFCTRLDSHDVVPTGTWTGSAWSIGR